MWRTLAWVALALAVAGAGWLVAGPQKSAQPVAPRGFAAVAVRVTEASGRSRELCALVATSDRARQQGMMRRRDLAGFDAMVFEFPGDTTTGFFMRSVPVALDIGWLDGRGRFLGSAEMAPCADRDGCPTYESPGPYRTAVETLAGDLAGLGLRQGAMLERGGAGCR